MRSEEEIQAKIKTFSEVNEVTNKYGHFEVDAIAVYQSAVLALRWALGEDYSQPHYCHKCLLLHENIVCPKCGGKRVIKTKLRGKNGRFMKGSVSKEQR